MENRLKERQISAVNFKRIIRVTKFPVTDVLEYLIHEMKSTHRFFFSLTL